MACLDLGQKETHATSIWRIMNFSFCYEKCEQRTNEWNILNPHTGFWNIRRLHLSTVLNNYFIESIVFGNFIRTRVGLKCCFWVWRFFHFYLSRKTYQKHTKHILIRIFCIVFGDLIFFLSIYDWKINELLVWKSRFTILLKI